MNPSLRIVLVDDDVNALFLLEQTLKKAFADCISYTFEDGQLALAYVLHNPVDLIITDNQMPGMDGSELAHELRAQGWGLPIIMISGSPDAEQRGIAAGITRFIGKGSGALDSELVKTISELLPVEPTPGAEALNLQPQSTRSKPKRL